MERKKGYFMVSCLVISCLLAFTLVQGNVGRKSENAFNERDGIVSSSSSMYVEWAKFFGKSNDDDFYQINISGSYMFVAGQYTYSGTTYKPVVVKYDLAGNQVWNITFGRTSSQASSVASDGTNVYVGSDDGSMKQAIYKFNSSGSLQWVRSWGSYIGTYCLGIALKGSYIYGMSNMNKPQLVKWDSNGNFQWSRLWNYGANTDDPYGIAAGDGIYLVGETFNGADTFYGDVFLTKYDVSGNCLWNRTWGTTSSEEIGYGVTTTSNAVYVAAYCSNSTYTNILLKYDLSGNLQWVRYFRLVNQPSGGLPYHGSQHDSLNPIATNGTHVFVVNVESYDVLLLIYNTEGNLIYNRTWGGNNYDKPNGVVAVGNSAYICGWTDSFGTNTWPYGDGFIIKYSSNTAPVITHPSDITYSFGASGNIISWTVTDSTTDTRTYFIYRNGSQVDSGLWTTTIPISRNVDGLSVGSYNYTIVASDVPGSTIQDTVIVNVLNVAPAITHPNDINYNYAATGNQISWTITDASTGTRGYTIYRNGSSNATGWWTSETPLTRNVDGLAIGSYNYTIVATDGLGGSIQDTVIVNVLNAVPTITHPSNILYNFDTISLWNWIDWIIIDASTGTRSYTIYRNGSSIATGSWTSGTLVTQDVNGLAVGSYNYTVIATDGLGGLVQDMVVVTVAATVPSAPRNLQATRNNNGASIMLSWNAPTSDGGSSIISYNVYRSTSSGGPYSFIGSVTGLSYVDSNVQNGVTYYFVVKAENSAGESQNSNQASFIPLPSFIAFFIDNIFLFIIIGTAAGIIIGVVATTAAKKRKLGRQSDGRTSTISNVGNRKQTTTYIHQTPLSEIPSTAPVIIPAPAIPSVQPILLPINERIAMFYCQSCNQNHEVKNPRFDAWYSCPTCGNILSLLVYCINCHNPMTLTKELYAAYKGKVVQCQTCNNQVAIE